MENATLGSGEAIVVDAGSHYIKAGYCNNYPCEEEPKAVCIQFSRCDVLSIIAKVVVGETPPPPPSFSVLQVLRNEVRVLENAADRAVTMASMDLLERLPAQSPIERGRVRNWDQYEALLDYAIHERLRCPRDLGANFLAAHPQGGSRVDKEMLAQLYFEVFGASVRMSSYFLLFSVIVKHPSSVFHHYHHHHHDAESLCGRQPGTRAVRVGKDSRDRRGYRPRDPRHRVGIRRADARWGNVRLWWGRFDRRIQNAAVQWDIPHT